MLILKIFFLILGSLISVSFIVLLERKLLGLVGIRLGPLKVSFLGILQSVGDAFKLMNKDSNLLSNFTLIFYFFFPSSLFFFSIFFYSCFVSDPSCSSFFYPILLVFLIMTFNVFNCMVCGWSVFSKYSLLGILRTISQLISYEVVLYICFLFLIFFYDSYNFLDYKFFQISFFGILSPFILYFWIPCMLAELNRTPFDFSEGESELVAGFMTDLGSYSFTMIFLSEYGSIIFLCFLSSFFFFNFFFFLSFLSFVFFVIWSRSTLPRHRFDKLMFLSWKFLIPLLTFYFLLFIFFIF